MNAKLSRRGFVSLAATSSLALLVSTPSAPAHATPTLDEFIRGTFPLSALKAREELLAAEVLAAAS